MLPPDHRSRSHLRHKLRVLVQFGAQRSHPFRLVACRPLRLLDDGVLLLDDALQPGDALLQLGDARTHVVRGHRNAGAGFFGRGWWRRCCVFAGNRR